MDKYIRVKNCNCISDATIEIVEKSLNIKYGDMLGIIFRLAKKWGVLSFL